MRRSIATGIIFAMVLAGCGGDGQSDDPAPSIGYLAAGGVAGVRYETATQSGVTDLTGSFRYLPGETVRFSVGGVQLGSVPAASQVTLFTLAGATAPTTEIALRRELDRALRGPTPFLRASNLARFLITFDGDGVPENGLDVTAAGPALANASIDFNQELFEFAVALIRLPGEKNDNIPYWRPVEQLFRAINVAIPAQVPLRTQTRGGSWLYPGIDVSYTYRSDGLRESFGQDMTFDGVTEFSYAMTYDAMGRTRSSRMQAGNVFEGIDYISDSTVEYDARGRYLRQANQTDVYGDGIIDSSYEIELEGDRFDGVQRQTVRHDTDADGVVDVIEVLEATADEVLRVETITSRTDVGVDGIIDSYLELTTSFDAQFRAVLLTEEYDEDGDGLADYRRVESFSYTDAPSTRRSELVYDTDGDGITDQSSVTVSTFDAVGNEVGRITEYDIDGNGVFEQRYSQVSSYDADRRRLTAVENQDYTGDGIDDYRISEFVTYTDFGSLLNHRREIDYEANGTTEQHSEQRYTYGTGGELLGWAEFNLELSPTDPWSWRTVENTSFANGVRALAQSYFEFNASF